MEISQITVQCVNVYHVQCIQYGEPNEDYDEDHDGKPGDSKFGMALDLMKAGAEIVGNLGLPC